MTAKWKGRGREQMLRKLFVPTKQNTTREKRESHREKSEYFKINIIRQMKSKGTRWAGQVSSMEGNRNT